MRAAVGWLESVEPARRRPDAVPLLCGSLALLVLAGSCAAAPPPGREAHGATSGSVLRVGPGRPLAMPSEAARKARDGDTIEIDAGTYDGDVAVWRQNGLTIRGVGGRAHVRAQGQDAEGKAIWVIKGTNTTVESIEFSGARVRDRNGAGIRQEGTGLTVRNCSFHDNENGIHASPNLQSEIVIERSEFANNGEGDGRSHNLYIGPVKQLTLRHVYSHHARVGHNLKSRAAKTEVLHSRFADEEDGNSSYAIELPNGGVARLAGNVIQQGAHTENPTLVSYGREGLRHADNRLYLENNTLINERPEGGFFVFVAEQTSQAIIENNVFAGPGQPVRGPAQLKNNRIVSDAVGVDPARAPDGSGAGLPRRGD
jgi:hypothetical protein